MSFPRLYKFAAELGVYPILLEGVLDEQVKRLSAQDELWYVPVELDTDVSLGHIKQYRVPNCVYDQDPTNVTEIRYDRGLDVPERRFVCCKELMHAFDSDAEKTNTPEKFEQLLDEIENPLPAGLASPMYLSEEKAKWMAILVLCPKPVRDKFKPQFEADELSAYDIALELQIPEVLIGWIMSDSYDTVYDVLVGNDIDQMELNGDPQPA